MQRYVASRPMFMDVEVMELDAKTVGEPSNIARGLNALYKEILGLYMLLPYSKCLYFYELYCCHMYVGYFFLRMGFIIFKDILMRFADQGASNHCDVFFQTLYRRRQLWLRVSSLLQML